MSLSAAVENGRMVAKLPSLPGDLGTAKYVFTEASFLTLAEVVERHVDQALLLAKGNKTLAAKLLGINRTTLLERLRRRREKAKAAK